MRISVLRAVLMRYNKRRLEDERSHNEGTPYLRLSRRSTVHHHVDRGGRHAGQL
jgi:hypothetical protein